MEKPAGYDEAQSFGEFETLLAGIWYCRRRIQGFLSKEIW